MNLSESFSVVFLIYIQKLFYGLLLVNKIKRLIKTPSSIQSFAYHISDKAIPLRT